MTTRRTQRANGAAVAPPPELPGINGQEAIVAVLDQIPAALGLPEGTQLPMLFTVLQPDNQVTFIARGTTDHVTALATFIGKKVEAQVLRQRLAALEAEGA